MAQKKKTGAGKIVTKNMRCKKAGSTKTTKGPAKHTCPTCGKSTAKKGHLCTPVVLDESVVCEYCEVFVSNPRHMCQPKVKKVRYACDMCGRVAVKSSEVCVPIRL